MISSSLISVLALLAFALTATSMQLVELDNRVIAGLFSLLFGLVIAGLYHAIGKLKCRISERNLQSQNADKVHAIARQLKELSYYDSVTQLPNREYFQRSLRKMVRASRQRNVDFSLFLIELQGHRTANQKFGHAAGERVLNCIAVRLKSVAHSQGFLVSRPGSNEFAVIIPKMLDDQHLHRFSQALLLHINKPVALSGQSVWPDVSIGIARFPDHGLSEHSIYANCALALTASKSSGAGQATLFLDSMQSNAVRSRLVEKKLLMNLSDPLNSDLRLHYQPKVNLESGKIEGVEALLRWTDSELGYINPLETFRLAEQNSLVFNLTEALLQQVIFDIKRWSLKIDTLWPVAFNLHPHLLENNQLLNRLLVMIDESGLPRSSIILEITEDCVMGADLNSVTLFLQSLVDRGFQLSLDDFGVGPASLTYLKEVPAQEIKIDRSFVLDIVDNPDSEAIVKALLSIAQETERSAVAEGIETREQLVLLRQRGCLVGQGYLFMQAVSSDAITQLLKQPFPFAEQVDIDTH